MKTFFSLPGLFLLTTIFCAGSAVAQTPIPAIPADPNQARPAQPVETVPVSPVAPAPAGTADSSAPEISVTVLADSSLRDVLQELAQSWADSLPESPQLPLTLANASTMLTQLQSNPGWDVVISADLGDVKTMTTKGLVLPGGQHTLARNTVVLYGRKALVKDDDLQWFDLIGTEWKKVALGNPDQVASGRVARHALQKHDLFDHDHQSLYVYARSETLAAQIAERDEADAVFVYRTQLAKISLPGFDVFPLDSEDAPPVFYTASIGRLAKNPDGASAFIAYCASDAAREIWAKYGFETN